MTEHVVIQIAPPRDNFEGQVAEGWYRIVSGFVELTDADGTPLPGDECRRELGPDDNAVTVAQRLLRAQHDRKVSRWGHSGPLGPMTWGSIA